MTKKKSLPTKANFRKKKLNSKNIPDNELKYVIFIVAVGFFLRFIYVLQTQNNPFVLNLFSDSKIYNDWAISIVKSGNWFGKEIFFMSPAYSYFLAVVHILFDNAIHAARMIQVLVSTASVYLIYIFTRDLFSKKTGIIAAALSAIFSIYIFYSGTILSETLQLLFILLLLIFLNKAAFSERRKDSYPAIWLKIGLLLGVTAIFRANILLFLIPAVLWLWFGNKTVEHKKIIYKAILFLTIGTAIPVSILTIRNYAAAGDFVLTTSNGGINFFLGNGENAIGIYHTPADFDLSSDFSGEKYAEKITGQNLSASETSNFWYKKGFNYVLNHPFNEIKLLYQKTILFFDKDENPQSFIMSLNFFRRNFSTVLNYDRLDFYPVFILALIGFILSLKNWRRFLLIYLFTASYIFSTILFFIIGRFRVGITPVFIAFAGYALLEGFYFIKEKKYKKLVVPVSAAVIFLLLEAFTVPDYSFNDYAAYLSLGDISANEGRYREALQYYSLSLKQKEYYKTYMQMGNMFAYQKDFKKAEVAFKKAIEMAPNFALAHFNIATLYSQTGRFDKALENYDTTVKLDPSFAEAYKNRAIIYYMEEKYEKSLANFEKYLSLTDNEQAKVNVRKDIEEIKRRLGKK